MYNKNMLSAKPSTMSIDNISGIRIVEEDDTSPVANASEKPNLSKFGPMPSSTKNKVL